MRITILLFIIFIFSTCQSRGTEDDPIVVRLEHNQAVGVVDAFGGDSKAIPAPPPPTPGWLANIFDVIAEFIVSNKELSVTGALAAAATVWYRRRKRGNPQPNPDKPQDSQKTPRNRRK